MSYEVSAGEWAHPRIGRHAQPAYSATRNQVSAAVPGTGPPGLASETGDSAATAEGEMSFWDFLDLINPLQHIPVISTFYRELTGDEISAPMRTLGGFLFTGPIGFVNGVVNGIVAEASGRDIGQNLFALLDGGAEGDVDAPVAAQTAAQVTMPPPGVRAEPAAPPMPSAMIDDLTTQGGADLAPGTLSGAPALRAFLSDLGAAGAGPRDDAMASSPKASATTGASGPEVSPEPPARYYPLPSRPAGLSLASEPVLPGAPTPGPVPSPAPAGLARPPASPQAHPLSAEAAVEPSVNEPSVADRMLEALRKYETMAQRRRDAGQGG